MEQISRENGISANTIYTWQRKFGAPVASQQSRTLRVDESNVEETKMAGKSPATDSTS